MNNNSSNQEQEAFLKNLHQSIFDRWTSRAPEAFQEFIDFFDPQLAGINGGVHEIFDNRAEFLKYIKQEHSLEQ